MGEEPTLRNTSGEATHPQRIGPYRIARVIAHGGMAWVFLAHQQEPVRRTVALKIIRSPFSRTEDRIRFQAEQQAMARLQHPNIAQMFEAGTTAEGFPFFVMEWLDGQWLTDYCDQRLLSIEKRLELFVGVCDGVMHAHQKGLVHRDLKPSNILVVEIDGRPVAKVIDFGVAKALDDPLVDTATRTGDGVIGTPAYVSREAIAGGVRGDIDTRADVYALGLILYKLLAGSQPHESESLPLLDRMLLIAHEDLAPPRQFFSRLSNEIRTTAATQRAMSPAALQRLLTSDLEAIVLKGAAREREPRYTSASELQADVRRFLANEPVEASMPGTFDRLRKFALRHRGAVAATLVVIVALTGGLVARTIAAPRADEARRQAELVTNFLGELFDEGNPWNGKGNEVSMHDLLLAGARKAEKELQGAPVARSEVLTSIGIALMHQGEDDVAYPLLREALELRQKALGPDDPKVASTLVQLGVMRERYDLGEGERYLRAALAIREKRLGTEHLDVANTQADLADVLRRQRRFPEAEALLLRSIAIRDRQLPPTDPLLAGSFSGLGQVYRDWGRFPQAESVLQRALSIRMKAYGPDHYVTSRSYDSLAMLRAAEKRWPDAEAYLRKDLVIVERVRGPDPK